MGKKQRSRDNKLLMRIRHPAAEMTRARQKPELWVLDQLALKRNRAMTRSKLDYSAR